MAENITRLDFPFAINNQEIRTLFKYSILNLSGQVDIRLTTEKNEIIGDCYFRVPENPSDLVQKVTNEKLTGQIKRNLKGTRSASFIADLSCDDLGDIWYHGINFNVTPGYKPGELSSDDTEIMKDFERVIKDYFKTRGN